MKSPCNERVKALHSGAMKATQPQRADRGTKVIARGVGFEPGLYADLVRAAETCNKSFSLIVNEAAAIGMAAGAGKRRKNGVNR